MAERERGEHIRMPEPARAGRAGVALVLALVSGLAGCVAVDGGAVVVAPAPVLSPLLAAVASARIGASRTVADPQFGTVRVTLDREYYSAAGVICRRFTLGELGSTGAAATRVACQETTGWSLVPLQGPSPGAL
jgi:hypothetical protein